VRRLQRLKATAPLRDLVAEVGFGRAQLIQPLFAVEGIAHPEPIPGLGDNERLPLDALGERIDRDLAAGVRQFMLFNVGAERTEHEFSTGFACRAIETARAHCGSAATLWVDTCLCSSTKSGHCCVHDSHGRQDLPHTLAALAQFALDYASAGADGIAPSDMNDGRTAHLRAQLDARGHELVPIMSYSSKFASHFYGPFRLAADSAPQHGDRRGYQLDVRSARDAIAASQRCAEEGADLLMVKPGMSSLDLIGPIGARTGLPVGAYQVSGEFAALTLLAREGLADFDGSLLESWQVLRRAGASFIITYAARHAARLGLS
jgi:porphobilinogen synthase